MKILIILMIISFMIILTEANKSIKPLLNHNCNKFHALSDLESKNIMKLFMKLPHRLLGHKNLTKLLCLLKNYLNKNKQNKEMMNLIKEPSKSKPFKWIN